MLRISKLADYATIIMVHLARHPGVLANAKDIAAETQIQIPTVSKLLKLLASAKLLGSTRGAQGGYSLAREPEAISLAAIIYVIDHNHGLTECSEDDSDCVLQGMCTTSGHWQVISRAVFTALESVSLAQLAKTQMDQKALSTRAIKQLQLNESCTTPCQLHETRKSCHHDKGCVAQERDAS